MLKIIAMNTIKKKCEVVMLPANYETHVEAGSILFKRAGTIIICPHQRSADRINKEARDRYAPQHLYVLSDDKIGESDWVMYTKGNKTHYKQLFDKGDIELANTGGSGVKKIIATTDTSLKLYESETLARASGFSLKTDDILLPQPTQEFIEKYIEEYNKGNIITEVLVEYEQKQHFEADNSKRKDTRNGVWYKKRLKVSPKDNTITIYLVKDSWNREEISELKNLAITLPNHFDYIWNETSIRFDESLESKITKDQQRLAKWIEENL